MVVRRTVRRTVRRSKAVAVAVDVDEARFALDPLADRLVDLGLDRSTLRWWLAVVLREGFALAAAGLVDVRVNRNGHRYSGIFEPPDTEGASRTELVALLLTADGGPG